MATITFDTLKFANKLKSAGVADKHAEAEAEAIAEVIQLNFRDSVTKEDLRRELKELEMRFDAKLVGEITRLGGKLTQLREEITLIKWMLAVLLAGVVSLVLKAFFV